MPRSPVAWGGGAAVAARGVSRKLVESHGRTVAPALLPYL